MASDAKGFSVEVLGGLAKVADVEESFAIAQFQDFKDAEELSKPAFQSEEAGLELAAADEAYKTGQVTERNVRYETVIIDTNYQRYVVPFFGFLASLFTLFLHGNATTKSVLRPWISARSGKPRPHAQNSVLITATSPVR